MTTEAPLLLSIETATLGGSVALCKGNEVIATLSGDNSTSHSNTLLREIDTVLKHARRELAEVDAFAVAIGPGSFTGLRIGIATVKGLASTLERPCVGIPTLAAIAHAAGVCERVVAALPAGRGEIFVQMFSVSSDIVTPLDTAMHVSPNQMLEKYAAFNDIYWSGEGSYLCRDRIKECADSNQRRFVEGNEAAVTNDGWRLSSAPANLAANVAALALRRIQRKDVETAEDLTAIYVRPSDAELKTKALG
jgi:tRNA threonylcarbamoyladenosine biosynthesis protein TsaB